MPNSTKLCIAPQPRLKVALLPYSARAVLLSRLLSISISSIRITSPQRIRLRRSAL